ncbi:GNAT family N-acetyltransferase [Paenibacillus sp. MBLB4367]|uniref:GNAT family N-acetyltransferase n=1 Tax=Paenibacillus sp. MBLB4367 TaxID=3384767 RepID=UPI00390808DA
MATVRRLLKPEEFRDAIALSDEMFRDAEQVSMGVGFPGVFSQTLKQSYGAFSDTDGKLVSFMGLVPSIVRIGSAKLNVYSLGSVCTDRGHRGQGYASEILQAIIPHMEQAGSPLLFVSGGRGLYTRLGCAQYGGYTQYTLDAASASAIHLNGELSYREMTETDWFHLQEIAEARPVRFEQSVWDLAQLIDAEALPRCIKHGQRVLVAERNGKPEAYLIIGIPNTPTIKQPPRAYEWGGPAQTVAALHAHVVTHYGLEQLNTFVPWHEEELHASLKDVQNRQPYRSYCTVMIVSPERLALQLKPYLADKNATLAETFELRKTGDEGSVQLSLAGKSAVVSPHELISLLFDVHPESDIDPALKAELSQLLPIPMPGELGLNYV